MKQYPVTMCAVIVAGILQTIRASKGFRPTSGFDPRRIPAVFRAFYQQHDSYSDSVTEGLALHKDYNSGVALRELLI